MVVAPRRAAQEVCPPTAGDVGKEGIIQANVLISHSVAESGLRAERGTQGNKKGALELCVPETSTHAGPHHLQEGLKAGS